MFRHLEGLAVQMVLGFLTHLLSQTTRAQGSISELLPETGLCGGSELGATVTLLDFLLVLRRGPVWASFFPM